MLRHNLELIYARRCGSIFAVSALCAASGAALAQPAAPPPISVMEFAYIPAADNQPGGPGYDFRMGLYEVRNDEFAAFLNDALVNLDNPRGQYLFFDIGTGNVHLRDVALGAIGTNGTGPLLFDASVSVHVQLELLTGRYTVEPGFDDHPVTGVSWFGAVKFCNWLTLADGLDPDDRAYAEGPGNDLENWHPISISKTNWAVRDLNVLERSALVALRGYRLPMDGGDLSASPGPFNEWYKAAAWTGAGHALYGFGRNSVGAADANFRCSADPFEDPIDCVIGAAAPVGYYDGVNLLADGATTTNPTSNRYGIHDLSGNVWEWMQDQSFTTTDRRNRGGSFRNASSVLRVDLGAERAAAAVDGATGFRIVQTLDHALLVRPSQDFKLDGLWGGPYANGVAPEIRYRVTNVTDAVVPLTIETNAAWTVLTLNPPVSDLLPGETIEATFTLNLLCSDEWGPGQYGGTVAFSAGDPATAVTRSVEFSISEPLSILPPGPFDAAIAYGDRTPHRDYIVRNASASPVTWSASWIDRTQPPTGLDWVKLNIEDFVPPSVLNPSSDAQLLVEFNAAVLNQGIFAAEVHILDNCTGEVLVIPLSLMIASPLSVEPAALPVATGGCFGAFHPSGHQLTLRNDSSQPRSWRRSIVPVAPETLTDWVTVFPGSGMLSPGAQSNVLVTINSVANGKPPGDYSVQLLIEELHNGLPTGLSVQRAIAIHIGDLVSPAVDSLFNGSVNGAYTPAAIQYTIQNPNQVDFHWTAAFQEVSSPGVGPTGVAWLDLSESEGAILNPLGQAIVSISPSQAAHALPSGVYGGVLTFSLGDGGQCWSQRAVELHIQAGVFSVEMVPIPAAHVQPLGPNYEYRMGRYEVTNEEFVHFLNDALANPMNTRGQHLVHDTPACNVRLAGDATPIFDCGASHGVEFDVISGKYRAARGHERFPVSGVSWFGAAKYCNWLTIIQGMDQPDQRTYAEGPLATDWRPVSITAQDYTVRDLNAGERAVLVTQLRGYRLPMDHGASVASAYNEWYKAAAWREDLHTNFTFGFGRNVLTGADANYFNSSDPFDPGATPVGFFGSGGRIWDDAHFGWGFDPPASFTVNDTANFYQLFDMTGNLAEWVQDFGATPLERGTRGGHFGSPGNSPLLTNAARGGRPAGAISPQVGFRVAQSVVPGALSIILNTRRLAGYIGDPHGMTALQLGITNPAPQTADRVVVTSDTQWIRPRGGEVQVPPGQTLSLPLEVLDAGRGVDAAAVPPGDFVLVRGNDVQPGGPAHDFWIARSEVTNREFAAFLNSAISNAASATPDSRSAHMYFNTDSGSVYINDQNLGVVGTAAPSATIMHLMYDASIGKVKQTNGIYRAVSGYEDHPVVGVTWFGAVKYCNWLSMEQGIPETLRAFQEAPSPLLDQWRPATANAQNWQPGAFDATARAIFLAETLGYRLPMDEESTMAAPYNEWYKAASHYGHDTTGTPLFGATYGTGRDNQPAEAEANFLFSGDAAVEQTTAVGFFDGVNTLFRESGNCGDRAPWAVVTVPSENGYGLVDVVGNVAEWVQDFGATGLDRAVRGGSWRDRANSPRLRSDGRAAAQADVPSDDIGFRVVRGVGRPVTISVSDSISGVVGEAGAIIDLSNPLAVSPTTDSAQSWTYGTPAPATLASYSMNNHGGSVLIWRVTGDEALVAFSLAGSTLAPAMQLEGTLAPGGALLVHVHPTSAVQSLPSGTVAVAIQFHNLYAQVVENRTLSIDIISPLVSSRRPLGLDPFEGFAGGPFLVAPGTLNETGNIQYLLQNVSPRTIQYAISLDESWVTATPLALLSGALPASGAINISVLPTAAANLLEPGTYTALIHVALSDVLLPHDLSSLEIPVDLIVDDWIEVTQPQEPWQITGAFAAGNAPTQTYRVTNHSTTPTEISVCVDQSWLATATNHIELFPQQQTDVVISIRDDALALPDGEYSARLIIENSATDVQHVRNIKLTGDANLSVLPLGDFDAGGLAGSDPHPPGRVFTLFNQSPVMLDWSATIQYQTPGDPPWLQIDGQPDGSGSLLPGARIGLVLTFDAPQSTGMAPGDHVAVVSFSDLTHGMVHSRQIIWTLATPLFAVSEADIPVMPAQPAGPLYSFLLGTTPVTNAEYVAFLNDALVNPDNERGSYMYFDDVTGDVYVNFAAPGQIGTGSGTRTTRQFSPAASGRIAFSNGMYTVTAGPIDYTQHPVTGVSWYGATKYCNWLTIDQGMSRQQRCYEESGAFNLDSWRPVSAPAAAYVSRDLNDPEREHLVVGCRGYRLPMDDAASNADPARDGADMFNEWFKAAAWDGATGVNRLFGFGRDVLVTAGLGAGRDANYRCSGDPFESTPCTIGGTTPAGYYGGPTQSALFPATPPDNAFGLFDMCGNVHQWMQDWFSIGPGASQYRAIRGGSWDDAADSPLLRTDGRSFAHAATTDPRLGFRVARTLVIGTADIDGDGDVDADDFTLLAQRFNGPASVVTAAWGALDFDGDTDIDLWDYAFFARMYGGG